MEGLQVTALLVFVVLVLFLWYAVYAGKKITPKNYYSKSSEYDATALDAVADDENVLNKIDVVSRLAKASNRKVKRINELYGEELDDIGRTENEILDLEIQLQLTRREIVGSMDTASVRRVLDNRGREMYGEEWTTQGEEQTLSDLVFPYTGEDEEGAMRPYEWNFTRSNQPRHIPANLPKLNLNKLIK